MQEVNGWLLENASSYAVLDVVATTRLDDHRLDALQMQQMRKSQARRARADDRDLGTHDRRAHG